MKITKSQLKQLIKEELDSVLSENTKLTTQFHMGLTAEVVRQLKYIVHDLETALKQKFIPDPTVHRIVDDLEVQLQALKGAYTPAYQTRTYGGEPIERSEFRPHRDQEYYDKIEKQKQNP